MNIHESLMDEFRDETKFKQLSPEQVESWLMGTFLFALVWSFGASTGNDARVAFDILVKEISKVCMYVHTYMHSTSCLHLHVCTKDTYVFVQYVLYVHTSVLRMSILHLFHPCVYVRMYMLTYVCIHTYV